VNIRSSAVIVTLILSFAAPSFSADQKPDFRQVSWGMSKDEVKKKENAEMVKETDSILVYLIKGGPKHKIIHTQPDLDGKSMELGIDVDIPDYNLVYLFPDGKLGMAILHMDNPKADPDDYLDEFDIKADEITEETGKEPRGMAKYGENETEDAIYAHPERICSGIYAVKLMWPEVNDKTNIMMELDSRKDAQDKSECTLSIFYDSVKFPVDPASSAKMHEVL
jgi:hypothetical protein